LKEFRLIPPSATAKLALRQSRISVHQIVRKLANGGTIEELLTEYPSLTREDIMACLDYAAELAEEQVTPI
jgi:uncharacterized protein (DUF433 family)